MAIRFHLDEHISPIVAEFLRGNGFDVTTSQDTGLLGRTDDSQLSFAVNQKRTLVTCDADFTRPETISQAGFGICFCHRDKYTIQEFCEALQIVAECMTEVEMHQHLEYL
ncbi:DUF5615 family PIN-like protein [Bythopirellula goksoeyrii]|uniref:DUF5615 domain-containing protein n=1 Tax=Bythopirellula goksoeyrii TaxID=1400387 RepID=A0A5B9Q3I6_9BACT|nr:DUF5615 family PIN-like protein [Bythopirellula goksoeyrii]QEG33537.1 hypothetical protein Pr1d_08010 [Bythopirellula goksoeyrii]